MIATCRPQSETFEQNRQHLTDERIIRRRELCQWCGYPEHTHKTFTHPSHEMRKDMGPPHGWEPSTCDDPWHGEIHGTGAVCQSCRMFVGGIVDVMILRGFGIIWREMIGRASHD